MIIAIIGEAGSGKTTASNFLHKQGAHVIIADAIVKYIYKMPKIEKAIIDKFDQKFVTEEGKLDKKSLRNYVFKNYEALNKLENIIWPEMTKIIAKEIQNNKNTELVILDCPVLFNAGLEIFVDKIILIEADEQVKIERIKARDNVSDIHAINLLTMQKQHLNLTKKVDYIIKNNGSIDDFIKQLMKIIKKIHP